MTTTRKPTAAELKNRTPLGGTPIPPKALVPAKPKSIAVAKPARTMSRAISMRWRRPISLAA